jgi:UPF0271 protein
VPGGRAIDLNADVGEATDDVGIAVERALLGVVTSANVACGGHAGDERSMAATVEAALGHEVRIGAHPSYPDRQGFGRRPMDIDRDELRGALVDQLGALRSVCTRAGTAIHSVKAHGALYGEVAKGGAIYETWRDAVIAVCGRETPMVLPSGCRALGTVLRDGLTAREEGFCDRSYRADGALVDRSEPGSVFDDPGDAASQAVSLARGALMTTGGTLLTMWVDTLCIHGDSAGALSMATAVRTALEEAGMRISAPT